MENLEGLNAAEDILLLGDVDDDPELNLRACCNKLCIWLSGYLLDMLGPFHFLLIWVEVFFPVGASHSTAAAAKEASISFSMNHQFTTKRRCQSLESREIWAPVSMSDSYAILINSQNG